MFGKKKFKNIYPKYVSDMNELEKHFFTTFYNNLPNEIKELIKLTRLSDGTINVEYKTYPIGKIKLYGRKHYMQILKSLYKVEVIHEDFENHIDDWIKYIYKYLLKEN